MKTLRELYKEARYPLAGNGPRNIGVTKKVFEPLDPEMDGDMYGTGVLMGSFEKKMAQVLGKEAAVFFPSGTMAQQVAMRIHCDRKGVNRVAYHPYCHMEIHEQDGLKELHKIESLLLGEEDRLFTLDDIKALVDSEKIQSLDQDLACIVHELPQREIGGQLPELQDLGAMLAYASDHQIVNHLDGARLFECLPYYKCQAKDIAGLFDTVYISFYKGIGGVAGAVLAGDEDFVKEAKIWKRRHGGDLICLYPYVLTSDYYYELRKDRMAHYWEGAKKLAGMFNDIEGVTTVPEIPVTNMFHVYLDAESENVEKAIRKVMEEESLAISGYVREKGGKSTFEISIGDAFDAVSDDKLKASFELFNNALAE